MPLISIVTDLPWFSAAIVTIQSLFTESLELEDGIRTHIKGLAFTRHSYHCRFAVIIPVARDKRLLILTSKSKIRFFHVSD